ncbi:uncharacterized protein LOC126614663 isoform X2 [Malus sylvestris]|uniref:uncharacterized protein LOC126614663 isoform X2 n=1 Tax=Malus sylvestris TaxID=3752 RepID=UPI0021AD3B76|nr:uncharacterized protein LOC126614663 isoform X2 [Malus sylvestris]
MMPDSVKLENLLGMLTIKLNDDNFIKWNFQFCYVLRGYDLFDHFTGESVCPPKFLITPELGVTNEISTAYKAWVQTDMALLSLLIATLSDDAMEYVVGCKTTHEAWTALQDRYMFVSSATVNHLKAELHTIQKGSDNVDKFLLRLKTIKDKLIAAGEKITDNDLVIAALTGLPADFDTIRTVVLARDTPISLKEFRAQLLGAEKIIEARMQSLVHSMAALYGNGSVPFSCGGNSAYQSVSHASSPSTGSDSTVPQSSNFGFGLVAPDSSNSGGSTSQTCQQFPPHNANVFSGPRNNFGNQGPRSFGNNNGHTSFGNTYGTQFGHSGYNSSGHNYGNSSGGNGYRGKGNGGYRPKFNGNRSGNYWSGNTSTRPNIVPECQICSRKGHTAVTCLYRNETTPVVQECQICGKKGHIAIDCRHRGNYAYQRAPPPPSLSANYAFQDYPSQFQYPGVPPPVQFPDLSGYQGVSFTTPQVPPDFQASVNQGQSNGADSLPRKE